VEMGLTFYKEKDRAAIGEAVRLAVSEGRPYDLELEIVSAKGVSKWIRTLGRPVMEKGRVVKVRGSLQDISDRKAMEVALRESEARFRALFEQAGVGVVEVEAATGRFLRVNQRICEILGYPAEELLALTFADVTHPETVARDVSEIGRLARGERASYSTEKRYLRKDGTPVWGALTVKPLQLPGDASMHMVSIIEDITARKRAEAEIQALNATLETKVEQRTTELSAANGELESFSYAVSHDLRAPLRALGGFSQALLEDYGSSLQGEGKTYLDQIVKASHRMAGLIDGILQLSRITRGDLAREAVDLSALAAALLGELASGDPERTVRVSVAPGLSAQGDPRMLGAALGNLLGNAWKYTAKVSEASIELDAVLEAGVPWLRLSDNGCGFDMAYADKLFRPFQRLHRQDEFPGMGIGLATVQRIILRHGGDIKASSAPGLGATFMVRLPSLRTLEPA